MLSSRHFIPVCAAFACAAFAQAESPTLIWWNTSGSGTDFATAANWVENTSPSANVTVAFGNVALAQPVVDTAVTVAGIKFDATAGNYTLTGAGSLTITAGGIQNLSGATQTIAAPIIFTTTASPITDDPAGSGGLVISGSVTNSTGSALLLNGSGLESVISGAIDSPLGLIKDGSGTWTLTGTSTGDLQVNAGTLVLGASNVLTPAATITLGGTGSLTLADNRTQTVAVVEGDTGAKITLAPGSALTLAPAADASGGWYFGTLLGAGNLTIAGGSGSTFVLGASDTDGFTTYSGAITVASGTVNLVAGATLGNGTLSVASGATLGVHNSGTPIINNPVTLASGAVLKALGGDSGLYFGGNVSVPAGNAVVNLGGTIAFAGGLKAVSSTTNLTFAAVPNLASQLVLTGPVDASVTSLTLSGVSLTFDYSGVDTLTVAAPIVMSGTATPVTNNSSGQVVLAGGITNNTGWGLMLTGTGASGVVAGPITGVGLVKSGSGSWTLAGSNTYAGVTSVNEGTLVVGASNTLPTATTLIIASGACVTLAAETSNTIAALHGAVASNLNLGAPTSSLTVAPAANAFGGYFAGSLSGAGNLTLAGTGNTTFVIVGSNSEFSGSTTISGGTLTVKGSNPLGVGNVAVGANATLAVAPDAISDVGLTNAVSVANGATLMGQNAHALVLNGDVTVPTTTATVQLGDLVQIGGMLRSASGTTALTLTSSPDRFGHALILGSIDTSSISSVTLNAAGLLFGSAAAVPVATSYLKGTNGYVGILNLGSPAPASAASVLGLIDAPNFSGALGFDSPTDVTTTFADAIDLTNFANVTLGSSTSAQLTGTITPHASGYKFGNGGGALVISSTLTGANNVSVSSVPGLDGNYLVTVFRGANDYTGGLSVANSLAILDSATALPAGSSVTLGAYGYVGLTENFAGGSIGDFATNRVTSYTATSVLGIDSTSGISARMSGYNQGGRSFSDTIDLRHLGSIYLGTATNATLSGLIYAPTQGGANGTLSLLAADDGTLVISSPLVNGYVNRVVVGAGGSPYASGIVGLVGANTFSGGTTLESGVLVVTQDSTVHDGTILSGSLGTGALTVAATDAKKALVAPSGNITLHNPIVLSGILAVQVSLKEAGADEPNDFARLASSWAGDSLVLRGLISGTGSLDVYGNTTLTEANTFSGGLTLHDGVLALGNDAALGTGTFTISPQSSPVYGLSLVTLGGSRTIANNVVFAGPANVPLTFGGQGGFTFTGSVAFSNTLSLVTGSDPVFFNGVVTGPGRFYGAGTAALVFKGGSSGMTGGVESTSGAIVFGTAGSLPTTPAYGTFVSQSAGYIGIGFVPADVQTTFIDRFDKQGTSGAIGFDSASAASPNTFAGNINLTGFTSTARLGSASGAILTGTITPVDTTYRFGNGGGLLQVTSALVDANGGNTVRSVDVTSAEANPLTVRLVGANTYTGGTVVSNSGVIFGAGALPASGLLSGCGYIGTEDVAAFGATPDSFINRFASSTSTIIGFDSFTGSFAVTGNITLSSFDSTATVFLGTATSATLGGNVSITLSGTDTAYRFAGYKGGQLTVLTPLSGAFGVIVGDARSIATSVSGDGLGLVSSVTLAGNNTYTGDTTLQAGTLYLGSDTALGTGTLNVTSTAAVNALGASILTAGGTRTISNAINLGSSSVAVGGAYDLILQGVVTGGDLRKVGAGTLSLFGSHSDRTGDLRLEEGNVIFNTAASVGGGALVFAGDSAVGATFLDHSTVNGISDALGTGTLTLTGKSLTVVQGADAVFAGAIVGETTGLTYSGSGATLKLTGTNTYTGNTTILEGANIVAGSSAAFGATSNLVTLSGGSLAVGSGATVSNRIAVTSGILGGTGTFSVPSGTTGFNIGSGIVLSPGMGGIGSVTFDGSLISTSVLILSGGGVYQFGMNDAVTIGGWDMIIVNGDVQVAATSATPFVFSLSSVGLDGASLMAMNFDPTKAQSWTILSATSITGFTGSDQFWVNASNFTNQHGGQFTIGLSGNTLTLNFDPVPEPSTYALLLTGLLATYVLSRRRRSAR